MAYLLISWLPELKPQRSAALDAGRMFEAAVQDIEYAFKYGYPKELQFKVGFPL